MEGGHVEGRACGGEAIFILVVLPVQVKAKAWDKPQALQLHVAQEKGPPFWVEADYHTFAWIGKNLPGKSGLGLDRILGKCLNFFKDELRDLRGIQATIHNYPKTPP